MPRRNTGGVVTRTRQAIGDSKQHPAGEAGAPAAEKLQVQVISRAASIMRALENRPEGLSLGQIAQLVDLPRSTVQRIAAALQAEQLLIAATPSGRLRLGPTIRRMAGAMASDTIGLARPIIRSLSEELGETVDLATVRGAHVVFLDQVVGTQRLRTVSAVGEMFPLHCTANGKAYLATLPDDAVRQLLGPTLVRYTRATVADVATLLSELHRVRRTGVAYDNEEHADGISAVGVCVTEVPGLPLAISVPVPSSRYSQRRRDIASALLAVRGKLAAAVGQ